MSGLNRLNLVITTYDFVHIIYSFNQHLNVKFVLYHNAKEFSLGLPFHFYRTFSSQNKYWKSYISAYINWNLNKSIVTTKLKVFY